MKQRKVPIKMIVTEKQVTELVSNIIKENRNIKKPKDPTMSLAALVGKPDSKSRK